MANPRLRLDGNVPGSFFVDSTCIDCDTCRQLAPATFREEGDHSVVHAQPSSPEEAHLARLAALACPTGSIGTAEPGALGAARSAFPVAVVENIFYNGYTSASSFGAWSYLVQRPQGNVMVDSPRFTGPLVKRVEEMGGVSTLFLTHRDDVADHEAWARHFGARRVMHAGDVTSGTRGVEQIIEGTDAVALDGELTVIPTPGHTRGHAVLLYRERFLFTGDHLAGSSEDEGLVAFRGACWYSWSEQTASMERLARHDFEWVLPGHGRIRSLEREAMRREMTRLVAWMRAA